MTVGGGGYYFTQSIIINSSIHQSITNNQTTNHKPQTKAISQTQNKKSNQMNKRKIYKMFIIFTMCIMQGEIVNKHTTIYHPPSKIPTTHPNIKLSKN